MMTTLTAPEEPEVATPPRERPQLRLRRAGRLERTVDLSDGKWSIGSSPRCQVRLPYGESQPLQCLLSLSGGTVEVTRWAAGVLLNGREFSRQALAAGDRLTIGGWDLEWQPPSSERQARLERKSRPAEPALLGVRERQTVDCVPPLSPANGPANGDEASPPLESPSATPFSPPATVTTVAPFQPETSLAADSPVAHEPDVIASDDSLQRSAAKTVLVSSRLTDPFHGLLGPAPQTPPTPSVAAAIFNPVAAEFQDRLVLTLWQARYAARERGRQVIAGLRAVQARVVELEGAIAGIEEQLARESAQAAADAAEHAAQVSRLEGELAAACADRDQVTAELEALRNAPPRTAPPDPRLQALADELTRAQHEIAELRSQLAAEENELESIRTQAEAAEADRRAEAEQFAAAQELIGNHEIELAAERATWEQQRAAADADADRLRDQLYACEMQIAELRGQVAEAEAGRVAVAEQLVTTQEAHRIAEETIAADRASWEQQAATAGAGADQLGQQLRASEMRIDELRAQVTEADAVRAVVAEQLAAANEQQSQWLAECQTLQENHAAALAEVTAERDTLQHQLAELAEALSQRQADVRSADASPTPVVDWRPSVDEPAENVTAAEETATSDETWDSWAKPLPSGDNPTAEPGRATIIDAMPRVAAACLEPAEREEAMSSEPVTTQSRQAPQPESPSEPTTPEDNSAQPYEPTSFIDKYRHLLEEGEDAEPSPRLSRPTLDDEYQSKRTSEVQSSADEDTDEALEAYMSNLMRRVRGDGSAVAVAAATAAAQYLDSPPEVAPQITASPALPAPAAEPEIEVDANGLLRLVRKQPVSTDLTALREIANNSARTAIARHHRRRHTELAVSKGAICLLASGASAFLMMTAPSMQSPWFWAGCATLATAAGTGLQLVVLGWKRLQDSRARRRTARFFQDERGRATAPTDIEASGAAG